MAKTIRSSGHEALREAIIAARKAAGLTQAQLADRLRCHQSFVARMESGQRRIDVVELVVISRAIGANAEQIFRITQDSTDESHLI
ncbi:MAG: helix-turn-helix transcriptional regulator [Sulfitobacter sp.]